VNTFSTAHYFARTQVLAGKIIGITSNKDSLLARYSDASIITGRILEADQHKIAPTASTIVCLAIGDALAVTLSSRKKFTLPEFGLRHPGTPPPPQALACRHICLCIR
jgi:arabinose-5-phosphate isomerase